MARPREAVFGDGRDVSCRVPKVPFGRRIIVGNLVLVASVCRGVVVVVLFDSCFVCLIVLCWRRRRPPSLLMH